MLILISLCKCQSKGQNVRCEMTTFIIWAENRGHYCSWSSVYNALFLWSDLFWKSHHQKYIFEPLLLALVLVENTCKKNWTEKCSKDPTYAIFLKSWWFKDVKYDVPMSQYHSTRPQPIQLVPTMQKKLFTLSFQPKFLKIWFTKVTATSIKSYVAVNFFVPQSQVVLGACFGP